MASFTVRVELHKAEAEDYENLHEKWRPRATREKSHHLMGIDISFQMQNMLPIKI